MGGFLWLSLDSGGSFLGVIEPRGQGNCGYGLSQFF
jgi:hypothetical protein